MKMMRKTRAMTPAMPAATSTARRGMPGPSRWCSRMCRMLCTALGVELVDDGLGGLPVIAGHGVGHVGCPEHAVQEPHRPLRYAEVLTGPLDDRLLVVHPERRHGSGGDAAPPPSVHQVVER